MRVIEKHSGVSDTCSRFFSMDQYFSVCPSKIGKNFNLSDNSAPSSQVIREGIDAPVLGCALPVV